MNNKGKRYLDFDRALDYAVMMEYINEFSAAYPFMSITSLGESILGRSIPIITLGEGESSVLYVGAHHGMEWMTSVLLLRFINEYCELYKERKRIFSLDMSYLYSSKSIVIIPMLNPDGVEYQINGVEKENPLYERLIKMNGESDDFSRWQANARGVDLNHNYNCGFNEYKKIEIESGISEGAPTRFSGNMPESEPETALLCNYLRFNDNIKLVLALHTQGREIYCGASGAVNDKARRIGAVLSRISGYKLSVPQGTAAYGGLTDWCNAVLGRYAYTIECGKGENPLPLRDNFMIYTDIREMLFSTPTFI